MITQPELHTERLVLRRLAMSDVGEVSRLAGDREVASTTLNIPHPYKPGDAESWISKHRAKFENKEGVTYAITIAESAELVGAISIIVKEHERGEMGYWIGRPYWNRGYATEAAQAMIAYGFDELLLNKITASHMARNPASGRVMQKVGMQYEGLSRQHVKKWDRFEDLVFYGILKEEYTGNLP